jgi:uncharacterized protein
MPLMLKRSWFCLLTVLLLLGAGAAQTVSRGSGQPKIRTVTAFLRLERVSFRAQVADAVRLLRAAQSELNAAGYEVETIRIATQPFSTVARGLRRPEAMAFFREFDNMAQQEGFSAAIGPAMLHDSDDPEQAETLAQILAATRNLNGFIVVADASGVHWNAIHEAARVNKYLEDHTDHGEGNFRFASAAFPPANAPFFPVSYTQDAGHGFAIGIESAGLVNRAFASAQGDLNVAGQRLAADLGAEAKKVEEIARRLEREYGWKYQGIDMSPVPLKDVSIGAAFESLLQAPMGSPGTLSVAYTITSAIHRIPVLQTGYSGLMLPVMEDSVLAQRWEAGRINRDSLLSYSAVCSAGLDTIPLPGDVPEQVIESIVADMASLSFKWHKPLSARLLPAPGRKVGEMTDFPSQYLVNIRIR